MFELMTNISYTSSKDVSPFCLEILDGKREYSKSFNFANFNGRGDFAHIYKFIHSKTHFGSHDQKLVFLSVNGSSSDAFSPLIITWSV